MTDDIRPQHANRRDYTRQIISTQPSHQPDRAKEGEPNQRQVINTINKQKTRTNRKKIAVILVLIGICALSISVLFFGAKHSTSPLPQTITSGLPYPVYYSRGSTNGYSYQPGSAKVKAGILFYTLTNRSKKIFITEQAAPSTGVNLSSLPKYSSLNVSIGKAVIGTGLGNPSVVIITPSTLIQLTSNKGVTQSDISSVAQKMSQQ